MEYIGIGICVIAVVAICIFIVQRKKNAQEANQNEDVKTDAEERAIAVSNDAPAELAIEMEMLPAEAIKDKNALIEITDSKVLAHVNNLVPGLAQAGNAANNVAQAVQAANGGVLYRAIIPAGAKLTDSKTMEGAVRGFYRGADGIQGHANLVAVEAQKGTAVVANTAAAAMGVASMVVGQYYMTQINAELGVISDGISEIQNFQERAHYQLTNRSCIQRTCSLLLRMEKFIICLKRKRNEAKEPSRPSWSGGFRASMKLCINIDADTGFQLNGDVVIPDGYLLDPASYQ